MSPVSTTKLSILLAFINNLSDANLVAPYKLIGAEALKESIELISSGKAIFTKQNESEATYANKINKSETRIYWKDKAENIIAKINAFNPKPGAWFLFKNERIKILQAKEIKKSGDKQDHKTNVKAYMTDWNMSGKPGFDKFE